MACKFCGASIQKSYCDDNCKSKYYYRLHKERKLEYQREYQKRKGNEAYRIRYTLDEAFKKKKNLRRVDAANLPLDDKCCEICGSVEDLQRHHHEYKKKTTLSILCRNCHNNVHHTPFMGKIAINMTN